MKKIISLIFLTILLISLCQAHQPRIVYKEDLSQIDKSIKTIEAPEISQAFYAELKGNPEYYVISSDNDFNLYLSLTLPYEKDSDTDFTFEIIKDSSQFNILNGSNYSWTEFHEEFANDDYWQGPSINLNVSKGEYIIKVSNEITNNQGKYVLVVGTIESFPLSETWKTIYEIPQLKIYFGKNPISAYFTIISLFFFWPVVILLVIIFSIIYYKIIRKKKNK